MIPPTLLAAAPSSSGVGPITVPHVEYSAILPELILIGGALAMLGFHALTRRRPRRGTYLGMTLAVAFAALGASCWLWQDIGAHGRRTAVAGAIAVDGFSVLFLILVSSALVLGAITGDAFLRRERLESPEFYVLAMLSASGAMFMAAANDLIVVFLGLEILSIALYVLAGLNSRRIESGEAAIKYFILGAFSSALFLYGIALVYGATGTTNLPQIASFLANNVVVSNGVLLGGIALLIVGFGFKVAAVPFHTWTPDVYQGSPTPVTSFMAAVAKAGGFAAFLRVMVTSFHTMRLDWQPVIWVVAVLTLVVGAVLAVVQRDIKRMLAYSSINHAGFVLIGLQAASHTGTAGSLYYLFTYTFMVMGSFAVVTAVGGRGDAAHDLDDYRGLGSRNPLLALSFTILLLAQAGIPFTTGFLAKFYVLSAAVDSGSYALAVIAMVTAAIAAFFYLRVVFYMYAGRRDETDAETQVLDEARQLVGAGGGGTAVATPPVTEPPRPEPSAEGRPVVKVAPGVAAVVGTCVAFTLVFGIWPGPIFDFAHRATLLF
jgi:NADH-quinone oxidoreductase subunit N